MNYVLKNTFLVFALVGLFMLPFAGFGMIAYQPESSSVLGVKDEMGFVSKARVVDNKYAESAKNEYKVVKQIDLKLSLSGDSYQKFYDVIPEELVDAGYTYLVVVPNAYKEKGLSAKIELNQLKADLVVTVPEEYPTEVVPITLLILR